MIIIPKSFVVVPGQINTESIIIIDNYINMIKFAKQNNKFKKVTNHLKLIMDKIPEKMQENWKIESGIKVGK
jgi:hypothetical protein